MTWLHSINWVYSASGFGIGLLVGFTGVGGGSLMTPLLVLLFGFHPSTAVGTDLLYAGLTKSGGTAVHGFNKTVDWRIVGRLALGSLPGTAATLIALSFIDTGSAKAGATINTVLGVALILTALTLVLRRWIQARMARLSERLTDRQTFALTVALGLFLGVMVSLTSVGAGAIGVTVLLVLYPRMPTVRIVGSDIAHAVPLTLLAGAGHWWVGSVDWALLGSLLVGSLPGIAVGSQLASRVPDAVLRPILAGTLVIVGARLAL
ncbi:sulfite exporter TauE/SafE family protein [Lichenibacterium dinghuense]|uniref:sulfite exporter TauE/SafE family protein n=1 Tax=Lichenibacterium dinghuense TaxID=2895977 RepID=UPI001F2207DB|nr:sulfite exporter TauE/SafE family protein [Lichenibacterium sp. 6Y81]